LVFKKADKKSYGKEIKPMEKKDKRWKRRKWEEVE
jgi:hypothetical protein